MSVALVMLRSSSAFSPSGVTAMPTSWMFCSRRWAVTMTSSTRAVGRLLGLGQRTVPAPEASAAKSAA
jgi:hypothetical protein